MAKRSVSSVYLFLKGFESHPFFIGNDVHKRSYHVAAVAYKAGSMGFGLAPLLHVAGIETLMAAPSRIPRAVISGAKTDRLNCMQLADYAAKGLIRSIAVPTLQQEAQRSLQRCRHDIVDSLRRYKQRIKGCCPLWTWPNRRRRNAGDGVPPQRSVHCSWVRMPDSPWSATCEN